MLRSYRGSTVPRSLQPIMPFLIPFTSHSFTRVSGWTLKGTWSFLRPCLQASRFPLRGLNTVRLCKRNFSGRVRPYYLRLNSGRSVSVKRQQNEQAFFPKYSRCAHVSRNNRSYARLGHILKIHHQASFVRHFLKLSLPSCSFHVGILFIFAPLGIFSW